jgi:glycosyltransferase involved in cell wall biosynthesis
MTSPSSIYVIVPAFNEARVIAETIAPLIQSGYTVVVVDDGSADQTWMVLEQLPLVRIRHSVNLGQGAALQTGMEYARRSGAEIIVHFDADGQHDPDQISAIIKPIQSRDADVVFGSRFLLPSDLAAVPHIKRIVLRAGRIVSGLITGVWLSDAHNGFRALSNKAVRAVRLRENGFAHATEILDEVRRAGLRYVEVPTSIRYTEYSRAKGQPLSNAVDIAFDLVIRKLFR